jgi:hypothetical protein
MYKRIAMNSTRITRHRFCLLLIVSLLFCGLSSIEVPEFVNLTDDTSNDFTLSVSVESSPSANADEAAGPELSGARESAEPTEHAKHSAQAPVHRATAPSPAEYRHLICTYRT